MGAPIPAVIGFSAPWMLFVFQSSLMWSIAFLFLFRLEFFLRFQRGYGSSAPVGEVGAKFGSCGSPDEDYQRLKLVTKPGSRRSPGGVLLAVEVVDGVRLP